jgi:hypothetical protein
MLNYPSADAVRGNTRNGHLHSIYSIFLSIYQTGRDKEEKDGHYRGSSQSTDISSTCRAFPFADEATVSFFSFLVELGDNVLEAEAWVAGVEEEAEGWWVGLMKSFKHSSRR